MTDLKKSINQLECQTYLEYKQYKNRCPDGHWDNLENHKDFANFIAKKEGSTIETYNWYEITQAKIKKYGGMGLVVSKYEGQTLLFLKGIFPSIIWYPWLFKTSVKGWCNVREYKLLYLEWIKENQKWKSQKDFYKLTNKIINDNYGSGIMNQYVNSVFTFLTDMLDPPEGDEEWYPWLFTCTPNNYWDDLENHKKYAKWLYKHLNFTKMEDWYKVDQNTFRQNSGSGLILNKFHYNSSHIKFLECVYPDYKWLPWLFKQVPQNYWEDQTNRFKWMDYFREQTGYKTIDDLYQITREDIKRLNGGGLMNHYYTNDYTNMIIELNPDIVFDKSKFNIYKGMAKFETLLIQNNILYKKEYIVVRGKKNGYFRVDFYLSDLNIAIEIDGMQHFKQVKNWQIPPNIQRKRDNYKSKIMEEKNIRMIRILQEEIIYNDINWLNKYIKPLLIKKVSTLPEYIIFNTEKYGNIYKDHNDEYNTIISIDELYLSNEEDEDIIE